MSEHSHGERLGGDWRWCETCHQPVYDAAGPLDPLFAFAGKKCPECKTVWPEHARDFLRDALATRQGQEAFRRLLTRDDFAALLKRYDLEEITE